MEKNKFFAASIEGDTSIKVVIAAKNEAEAENISTDYAWDIVKGLREDLTTFHLEDTKEITEEQLLKAGQAKEEIEELKNGKAPFIYLTYSDYKKLKKVM
jgi:hypothetical protein